MSEIISRENMGRAEDAIELIAKALKLEEKEVVGIIEDGLFFRRTMKLSAEEKYLIDELKSTFDAY